MTFRNLGRSTKITRLDVLSDVEMGMEMEMVVAIGVSPGGSWEATRRKLRRIGARKSGEQTRLLLG